MIVGFLNLLSLALSATAPALLYLLHPCSRPAGEGMKAPTMKSDEYNCNKILFYEFFVPCMVRRSTHPMFKF
jgi:hypothetical protein